MQKDRQERKIMKIALLQMTPCGTLKENLQKGVEYCKKAKERGADLALFELDLKQLRSYRGREVHANAYRHPKKYGLLTDTKIREPFVRNNYRE